MIIYLNGIRTYNLIIFKELLVLNDYLTIKTDTFNEKHDFLNMQLNNNAEIDQEIRDHKQNLSWKRQELKNLEEDVKSLDNEVFFIVVYLYKNVGLLCLKFQFVVSKRELVNISRDLNNFRIGNKHFDKKISEKQNSIGNIHQQV